MLTFYAFLSGEEHFGKVGSSLDRIELPEWGKDGQPESNMGARYKKKSCKGKLTEEIRETLANKVVAAQNFPTSTTPQFFKWKATKVD